MGGAPSFALGKPLGLPSRGLGSFTVRQYFGTDGVRGVVGEFLTVDLVERLGGPLRSGRATAHASSWGVTRASSGEEFEEAFARGVASAGGSAVLAGVVPTPAVALLRLDLGVVITASHNPPEYNGVKFFGPDGRKLRDEQGGADRSAPRRRRTRRRQRRSHRCRRRQLSRAYRRAFRRRPFRNADRGRLRERRVLRPGAACVRAARCRGACDRQRAQRRQHQRRLRCNRHALHSSHAVRPAATTSESRSTATAIACSRSTRTATSPTATRSLRSSLFHLGVDVVAVTSMSNLGLHRLLTEHGIRVLTTDVGDRYVLEALYRGGRHSRCRAVRPHHLPARPRHRRRACGRAAFVWCPGRTSVAHRASRHDPLSAGDEEHPAQRPWSLFRRPCSPRSTSSISASATRPACSSGPPEPSRSCGFSRRPRPGRGRKPLC